MLILHTSDWHIGKTTRKHSRAQDIDSSLTEIVALARQREPDLVLITGDLFDHAHVAGAELDRGVRALKELVVFAPVIALAGNHDSPNFMRALDRLSDNNRLRFVTEMLGPDCTYLTVPDKAGNIARIGLLPFVFATQHINVLDDPRSWERDYAKRIAGLQTRIAASLLEGLDPSREMAIYASHLYVNGAELGRTERAGHVSDQYAVDPADIPAVDYAAFGHIHLAQPLPGRVRGGYAGSIIPLDFGELGQTKSVTFITLEPGRPPVTELVPISGGRPLRHLKGTFEQLQREAATVGDALCLVTVHTDAYDSTINQRVHDLLEDATILGYEQIAADSTTAADAVIEPTEPGDQLTFTEELSNYLATPRGNTVAADLLCDLFTQLHTALEEERDPVFAVEELLSLTPGSEAHQ